MIYTCYEMIRDCRADKPEGWSHFISNYIPVICKVVAHYAPDSARDLNSIVKSLRRADSPLFQTLEPSPERWFVAELRQEVVAQLPAPTPESPLDLEAVAAAYEPLTLTEKQAAWMEAMLYSPAATGVMMRMAPATVTKIRDRGAELLRAKVDVWNRRLIPENGRALGKEAAAASNKDCQSAKVFLDILDGRTSWYGRDSMEVHVRNCWHCIDLYSRMVEVIHLLRGSKPLTDAEAQPYRELLNVAVKKKRGWF